MPTTPDPTVPPAPAATPATGLSGGVDWNQFHGNGTSAPGTFSDFANDLIGWTKTWGGIVAAIAILAVALLMMLGVRSHSGIAREALARAPLIWVGALLVTSASAIAAALL